MVEENGLLPWVDVPARHLRDHVERFLAAGSGQEEKAFRHEHDSQQLSDLEFIVHDQNVCRVVSDVGTRVRFGGL